MSGKKEYEVRIRIQIGPDKWIKKSRFYKTNGPKEAVECYDGPGQIMWVRQKSKEALLGIGEFFKLGDSLLKELGGDNDGTAAEKNLKGKEKTRQRRFYHSRRGN